VVIQENIYIIYDYRNMWRSIVNYLWTTTDVKEEVAKEDIKEKEEEAKEETEEAEEAVKSEVKEEKVEVEEVEEKPEIKAEVKAEEKAEKEAMKFIPKEFDIKTMHDSPNVLVIGKRSTGKTTLLKHIKDKLSLNNGLIFSGTAEAEYQCYNNDNGMRLHKEFDSEILGNYLNTVRKCASTCRKNELDMLSTVIILDDCINGEWAKDKNLHWIAMNGRHVKTALLSSCQYAFSMSPVLRTNLDYIFIFRENNEKARRKLYDQYCGMFPNFDLFTEVLNDCTKDHECLVIDNSSQSEHLEDQVFRYRVLGPVVCRSAAEQALAREHQLSR
jgi:hypothetical protein